MSKKLSSPAFCLLVLLAVPAARAEELPKWELGVGAGGVMVPDYKGSDQTRYLAMPFPYFAYRLDWLDADRDGVRAKFFDSDRIELNLSADGSAPLRRNHNRAREGMPGLDYILEVGPSLDVNIWKNPRKTRQLKLVMPVRQAFKMEGGIRSTGWTFSPHLDFDFAGLGRPDGSKEGWHLNLQAGPMFADRRYNAHFYDVAEEYVRADRSAYRSRGGYAGSQFQTSISRRFGSVSVGAYAEYDYLRGAVFDDSPLMKRRSNIGGGIFMTWTLMQSNEYVSTTGM
jgi:outer membrane protein